MTDHSLNLARACYSFKLPDLNVEAQKFVIFYIALKNQHVYVLLG